jgi:hypothetical protein
VVAEPLLAAADAEIDRLAGKVPPQEGDGGPGPNLWFTPRAIYYRLAVPGHADRWASTFLEPWTEYDAVRRAANGPATVTA